VNSSIRNEPDLSWLLALGQAIVQRAQQAGAEVAEAVVREGDEVTARVREGDVELLRESAHRSVGLRVMRGQCVASTSSSDLTEGGLARLVADAVELLALSQPDPHAGPADPALLAGGPFEDLELHDPDVAMVNAEQAIELALRAERAARGFDARITVIQDCACSRVVGGAALVLSSGFEAARMSTSISLSAIAIADDADHRKRRGSWRESRRHCADLPPPEQVGQEAARRAVAMLGARKLASCEAPVVFPEETAGAILGLFASAVLGSSVWRKTSYLARLEGERVASDLVTILDDPTVVRGFGSRAFDGEGLPARRNLVVDRGVLKAFLCDSYSARKLGRACTGSAARGSGGAVGPSTSNFILQPLPGASEADIIRTTERGLLVRSMMGFGFNPATGDLSRGASGHWIQDGQIAHPVSEVTISANLQDLLQRIDRVADRCNLRASILCPALRVSEMAIGGS
jgi:PmbA protein